MFRLLISIALTVLVFLATPASALGCEFKLGFKALRDLVGHEIVGECLENEYYNEIGDSVQQTTGGLLVWRKADNWTAFTDGYRTWLNGPAGLEQRLNAERFAWEAGYADYVLRQAIDTLRTVETGYEVWADVSDDIEDTIARSNRGEEYALRKLMRTENNLEDLKRIESPIERVIRFHKIQFASLDDGLAGSFNPSNQSVTLSEDLIGKPLPDIAVALVHELTHITTWHEWLVSETWCHLHELAAVSAQVQWWREYYGNSGSGRGTAHDRLVEAWRWGLLRSVVRKAYAEQCASWE